MTWPGSGIIVPETSKGGPIRYWSYSSCSDPFLVESLFHCHPQSVAHAVQQVRRDKMKVITLQLVGLSTNEQRMKH
jgi:hypothetical protein